MLGGNVLSIAQLTLTGATTFIRRPNTSGNTSSNPSSHYPYGWAIEYRLYPKGLAAPFHRRNWSSFGPWNSPAPNLGGPGHRPRWLPISGPAGTGRRVDLPHPPGPLRAWSPLAPVRAYLSRRFESSSAAIRSFLFTRHLPQLADGQTKAAVSEYP
jgi:hypothetical protein